MNTRKIGSDCIVNKGRESLRNNRKRQRFLKSTFASILKQWNAKHDLGFSLILKDIIGIIDKI